VRIVQIVSLIFLFTGCLNEPDCIITSTNLVKINFKKDSKTQRQILFTKINVSGSTKDFYAGENVSYVELPVKPDDTEATFTFYFEGRTETMLLTYTRKSEVISASCGAFTNYSDLTMTETSFDLYNIINNQLLINAPGNLEVFVE
jgi:antitoxin component YwqK of YwqJK toxin-antitoxin module